MCKSNMTKDELDNLKIFDIILCDFTNGREGFELVGCHPFVICQNNLGNKFSPTVLGMGMTSNISKSYMQTHCVVQRDRENGLKYDSVLMGETLTQISKERIIYKIGSVTDERTQEDIMNIFLSNITGKKSYGSGWTQIVKSMFQLIRESNDEERVKYHKQKRSRAFN